jgi:hypothetical protein
VNPKAVAAACILLFAGAAPAAAEYPVVLSYQCNDVVVVARIQTLGFTASVEDNILDRAQFMMRLEIKKVVRGVEHKTSLTTHQFLHEPWRNDRDYLIVLAREDDEEYRIREAALWDVNPQPGLVNRCPWLKAQ